MRLQDQVLSEADFEQLPPALRRKYFSSLERLRLAHDVNGNSSKARLRSLSSKRPSTSHDFSNRKSSLLSASFTHRTFSSVSLPRTLGRTRTRLHKASQQLISPSTTLLNPWDFAALPSAIQRKHFSPEEQYYIASRINPFILDAADEALYKQYRQPQTLSIDHPPGLDPDNSGGEDCVEEEDLENMDLTDLESFRWLDNDTDLDLRLDDYHAINADLSNKQLAMSRNRRSFRRGLSFSNVSFGRRSSSSLSLRGLPTGSNMNKTATPLINAPPSQHQRDDSSASVDPSATHYQDPAARMKLRVYLASPQKFDEALEFGFPSIHKDAAQPLIRPKTSPGHVNGQPKTFFADDTPSLSEDESRDGRSDYLYQDSPRTPIDMSFPSRPSQKSSTDRSTYLRPRVVETYAHASASDREMTLRMTLTRPELRALEQADHSKPTTINSLPLERAPLTVPVSETRTIWDDLPEEPSRMKRFFKKLKGRV